MIVKVKVTPKSKKEAILKKGEFLKVYVNAPPQQGKANKRLIEILAEYYKVKKDKIKIRKGEHCREKIVEISEDS